MISKDLAKKIRYIQIRTSRTVNDIMAGEYRSAFRGSGMEFDEVREYQPGDDVRSIDWNVTARQGRPYIKRFHEERELTVLFAVDLSASGQFGTKGQTKNDLAAELCALLSFSAVKSNDKAGLLLFTDRIEKFIPPAKGTGHAMRLIREVLGFTPQGTGTDIAGALDYIGRVQRKRAIVFVISDFQDSGYDRALRLVAKRHDVIAAWLKDAHEESLKNLGLISLEDAETGEILLFDSSHSASSNALQTRFREQSNALHTLLTSAGIDLLPLTAGEDYAKTLAAFFRRRGKANQ